MQNTTSTTTAQATPSIYEPHAPVIFDEPDLSDDELAELEARLSRDHDDAAYWQGGAR